MKSVSKLFIVNIVVSITLVMILVLGFFVGRYSVTKELNSEMDYVAQGFYLGNLLSDEQKQGIASAYSDKKAALNNIDEISWAVPNIPTPFVGNAPMPGKQGTAHINAMQFRATTEVAMPKPKDTYRIFITGGSTAYGSGAPSQETTIASYLNTMLTDQLTPITQLNYEVFTMANPAWASTHERIVIENRLSELDPDLVISFSGNNDVHWGRLGRNILWFRTYADDFFLRLIKTTFKLTDQPEIPEVTQVIEPNTVDPELVSQRLLKNITLSSFILTENEVDYLFILQPTLAATNKPLTEREQKALNYQDYFQECYKRIDLELSNFKRNNFQYINFSTIFDDISQEEEIFLDSYHFGDKGNKIIANNIFLHIKDNLSR